EFPWMLEFGIWSFDCPGATYPQVAFEPSACNSPPLFTSHFSLITLLQMAAANDLRKGMPIKYNGNPAIVLEVHHRTPANHRAFVQAILRYINPRKSAD